MHTVKILASVYHNPQVKHIILEKPSDFNFNPGQSLEIGLIENGDFKCFSPISCPDDPNIELMIKNQGPFTRQLHNLEPGNEILLRGPVGKLSYKGPGTFIAGGSGITPFLSIFRALEEQDGLEHSRLIYFTRTGRETIYENILRKWFRNRVTIIHTGLNGRIDKGFLEEKVINFKKNFYLCGPDEMMRNIRNMVLSLGAKDECIFMEGSEIINQEELIIAA